ncbi:MAG: imidazoleglycerol-phosphate dehydratase [Candidatus Parcubacteria bacterium]|nr:imidazoleglycerol-phosphate dehydratase [Candidatus Parcubacteria bacterium]
MKEIKFTRKTNETNIEIHLNIGAKGKVKITTSINFLNSLLEKFAANGNFLFSLKATSSPKADQRSFVKDVGISLGKAFRTYIKDAKGLNGVGFFAFPLDESLAIIALDLNAKAQNVFKAKFKTHKISDLKTEYIKEFLSGFSQGAACNLTTFVPYGNNDRLKAEAIFKGLGKALSMACSSNYMLLKDIPAIKGLANKF